MKELVLGSKPSDLTRQLTRRSDWSVTDIQQGKVDIHSIDEFPIGVISDIHGNYKKAVLAIARHPEIKQWFCLGDIVDYVDRYKGNDETLKWWSEAKIPTILGNHDRDIVYACRVHIDMRQTISSLPRAFRLLLPTGLNILGYHSKPNDMVSFVNPGYTEREFVDDYNVDEDTVAVIIGHNHKQFKSVFYTEKSELWSVGSIGVFGEYATIDLNGVHFHKIT